MLFLGFLGLSWGSRNNGEKDEQKNPPNMTDIIKTSKKTERAVGPSDIIHGENTEVISDRSKGEKPSSNIVEPLGRERVTFLVQELGADNPPHLKGKVPKETHSHKGKVEARVESVPDSSNKVGTQHFQSLEGDTHVNIVLQPASGSLIPSVGNSHIVLSQLEIEDLDVAHTAPSVVGLIVAVSAQNERALSELPGKVVLETDAPEAEEHKEATVPEVSFGEPGLTLDVGYVEEGRTDSKTNHGTHETSEKGSEESTNTTFLSNVGGVFDKLLVVGELTGKNENRGVKEDPRVVFDEPGDMFDRGPLDVGNLHHFRVGVFTVIKLDKKGEDLDGDDHLGASEVENVRSPVGKHSVEMGDKEGDKGERDTNVHRHPSRKSDNQDVDKESGREEDPNVKTEAP